MFGKKKENAKIVLGNLVEGLPVPGGTDLMLKLTPECAAITITSTKQTYEINISKITSIQHYNATEFEKVAGQSVAGMLVGGAAFGLVGAMVGGRVKEQDTKTVKHYVVLTYDYKQIIIQTNYLPGAVQIVDYFNELKPVNTEIISL